MKNNGDFTIDEIQEAYSKLKSYVYYDNSDLFLRKKIADFESSSKFVIDEKGRRVNSELLRLTENLNLVQKNQISNIVRNSYFLDIISKVDTRILPKGLESDIETKIISNVRNRKKINVKKVNTFICAPVEVHIISILWIMRIGFNLESRLSEECYGNRLILKSDGDGIVSGKGLFKPYHKQYSQWRNSAISAAENQLASNIDVMIVNLDVRNYYHSIRISKENLIYDSNESVTVENSLLIELLHKIHLEYSKKIGGTEVYRKYPLPIGLCSSGVLANVYLKDFDDSIVDNHKPLFYGRYVDDILIVVRGSEKDRLINDENYLTEADYKSMVSYNRKLGIREYTKYEELGPVEKFMIKSFHSALYIGPSSVSDSLLKAGNAIRIKNYELLEFQPEKTTVYYFNHSESSLALDKLRMDIIEKSSDFKRYDFGQMNRGFEDSAYHLLYDDSQGKIKTLKDYKENRYGLSIFFSKAISLAVSEDSKLRDDRHKIVKYFQGTTTISLYSFWERVLTFLLVCDDSAGYKSFASNTIYAISNLNLIDHDVDYNTNDKLMRDTIEFFEAAHQTTIALKPTFVRDSIYKWEALEARMSRQYRVAVRFSESILANNIRLSGMVRDKYTQLPLVSYSSQSRESLDSNLLEQNPMKVNYGSIENISTPIAKHIKFWECCLVSLYKCINVSYRESDFTDVKFASANLFRQDAAENSYLDYAMNIYTTHNSASTIHAVFGKDRKIASNISFRRCVNSLAGDLINPPILVEEINFVSESPVKKFKVAIANTAVEAESLNKYIRSHPKLATYGDFSKLGSLLEDVRTLGADLLVLPECYLPLEFLPRISWFAAKEQIAIVVGLKHITVGDFKINLIVTVLPFESNGVKDAVVIPRIKNNYSHHESYEIEKYRFIPLLPSTYVYNLFSWKGIYFSPYYCIELGNIFHRSIFKSCIDILVASEWNPDTTYFSNIVESSARDLHAYVVQVNTSQYGDSRICQPTKSEKKDILKLKGGENDAVLISSLDVAAIRAFQAKNYTPPSCPTTSEDIFKPLPHDFNLEFYEKRCKNQLIFDHDPTGV